MSIINGVNLKEPLIAGVDPGITTAVAILDAYGNVLDVYSKRDLTRADIINHILRFGTPVIISSDVNIVPKSVEKIATKLGCAIYSPDMSLRLDEKRELTKEYYRSLKNDHEVDALSAAIKAWKYHRVLFHKVDDILKKLNKQELFSDIMLKILKEESPNIEDAVREFIEKEQPIVIERISKEEIIQKGLIEKLQKSLTEKQKEIKSLQDQNVLLSKALNELRKEIGKLKENKTEVAKTEDYHELKESIDYIKKLRKIEIKDYYPVIGFDNIDGNLLESVNDRIDLEGRVILVKAKENLNLLNNLNIRCLLTLDEVNNVGLEFPVIQIDENELESFDDIKTIKIDYIEKRLADAKKIGLIGWLKGYRKRKD